MHEAKTEGIRGRNKDNLTIKGILTSLSQQLIGKLVCVYVAGRWGWGGVEQEKHGRSE